MACLYTLLYYNTTLTIYQQNISLPITHQGFLYSTKTLPCGYVLPLIDQTVWYTICEIVQTPSIPMSILWMKKIHFPNCFSVLKNNLDTSIISSIHNTWNEIDYSFWHYLAICLTIFNQVIKSICEFKPNCVYNVLTSINDPINFWLMSRHSRVLSIKHCLHYIPLVSSLIRMLDGVTIYNQKKTLIHVSLIDKM